MATIGDSNLNISDWALRMKDDGMLADIVNTISEEHPEIQDIIWKRASENLSNMTTQRTSEPTLSYTRMNIGAPSGKSGVRQVNDTLGMVEIYSKVDVRLLTYSGEAKKMRADEEAAFFDAYGKKIGQSFFYANTLADAKEPMGLSARYNELGTYVLDGTVTGQATDANSSVWMVEYGDSKTHGIFPKNGSAGLQVEDLGRQLMQDDNGNDLRYWVTHFKWDMGWVVKDPRRIIRIPNLNLAKMRTAGESSDTSPNIWRLLTVATHRIQGRGRAKRTVIYMNPDTLEALDIQAQLKTNVNLPMQEWYGMDVPSFRGIPIRETDALLTAEAKVS